MKYPKSSCGIHLWFGLLLCGVVFCAQAATSYHVVKPGESVWTIARKHGVSPKALSERNGLSQNQHIHPNQRLALPARSTKSSASKTPEPKLSGATRLAIQKARVNTSRWRYIVIHHSGVDLGNMASMERYHRDTRHMENGLAYHFVIGNGKGMEDGEIGVSRRWTEQLDGGHVASDSMNHIALGICLVGNFDETLPTRRQMDSLKVLVRTLMARCKISRKSVKSHQEINIRPTRCPGSRFPMASFMKSL